MYYYPLIFKKEPKENMYKRFTLLKIFIFTIAICSSATLFSERENPEDTETPLQMSDRETIVAHATAIAQNKLSLKSTDPAGLILLQFARYISRDYRPLLLLRAKLKYNIPLTKDVSSFSNEESFISFLIQKSDELSRQKDRRSRHIELIFRHIVRLFDPNHEPTLIRLIQLEDAGAEVDINKLFQEDVSKIPTEDVDPKDSRYSVGNVAKTVTVPSKTPWTDTFVKVEAGKIINFKVHGAWSFGEGPSPMTDADGFASMSQEDNVRERKLPIAVGKPAIPTGSNFRTKKKNDSLCGTPGCLMARIGKAVYYLGKNAAIKVEESGILYLGPFEWSDYTDNSGELRVSFEVSDK